MERNFLYYIYTLSIYVKGDAGCNVELTCKVDIPYSDDCEDDYLKVTDGVDGEEYICGKTEQTFMASTGLRDLFMVLESEAKQGEISCTAKCSNSGNVSKKECHKLAKFQIFGYNKQLYKTLKKPNNLFVCLIDKNRLKKNKKRKIDQRCGKNQKPNIIHLLSDLIRNICNLRSYYFLLLLACGFQNKDDRIVGKINLKK